MSTDMRKTMSYIIIAASSMLLLAGCCTARHSTAREYKVAYPSGRAADANQGDPNADPKVQEAFMNDLAKSGWIFVEREPGGLFYFKRAKQ